MAPASDSAAAGDQQPSVEGYVANIDGRMISNSHPVELSTGCHLLQTPTVYTTPDSLSLNRIERSIVTGRRSFAVPMRAGHRYVVEVEPWSSAIAPRIVAYELDADSYKTRVFEPIAEDHAASGCAEPISNEHQARLPVGGH